MSDTPRTDAASETLPSMYEFIAEMERIERELNAANERIKRLIELGLETSEYGLTKYREMWEKEANQQ